GNDEGVHLARWLEGVPAFWGHPVMLEVVPCPFQYDRVHGPGVPVAGQHPRPPDAQQVDVVAMTHTEHQGPERHVLRLRQPQPFVARKQVGDDEVCDHSVRHRGVGTASWPARPIPGRAGLGDGLTFPLYCWQYPQNSLSRRQIELAFWEIL